MRKLNALPIALALGLLLAAAPVSAQDATGERESRVLSATSMDAALMGHVPAATQTRAELSELLSQPRVQQIAADRGIDMEQVEAAAAGLSDTQMGTMAPLMAKVTAALQTGGSITISVVALIIILLLLILLT